MAKLQTVPKEYPVTAIAVALIVALFFYDGGNYLASGAIVGVGVLSYWLGRWFERRTPADKFHFFQPWKIPDPTTRGAIWLIAAFDGALHSVRAVAILALVSVASSQSLSLDVSVSFVAILAAMLMALATLGSYWAYRRRYEPIAETGGLILRYAGKPDLTFREKCGLTLAIVGVMFGFAPATLLIWLVWFN